MSGRASRSRLDILSGRAATATRLQRGTVPMGTVWSAVDHLVTLASHGAEPALLAARFGTTGRDPFLRLAARADATDARRMTSALLLSLAADEDLPAALIVDRHDPVLTDVVTALAGTIPGAVLYPRPTGSVIPLRTAAMTLRIARAIGRPDILVLDLRSAEEAGMTPPMSHLQHSRTG